MKLSTNRIYWIAFLVITAVFAILKCRDLATPYFWDELGVYAPGSLMMKDRGSISLLPSSLVPLYSRGHPLLSFAVYAAAFKFFGDTVVVGHACTLVIALATLLASFLFAKETFGPKTAIISVLLICIQPVFYAMSAIVMPEMLMTLFIVLAVWGVVAQRWYLYILAGSLAILTKEAAIVLPVACFAYLFIAGIAQRDLFKARTLLQFVWAGMPLLVFAIFLLVQKHQNGWYLFPLHTGYSCYDPLYFIPRFFRLSRYPLLEQGRWLLGLPAISGAFIVLLFPYSRKEQTRAVHMMSLLFIMAMLFSSMNYFLPRYSVFVIPFVVIAGVHFVIGVLEREWPGRQVVVLAPFTIVALVLAFTNMDLHEWADCWNMSYKRQVYCERRCINWAERQRWRDSLVEANFPIFQGLKDKRNGYLKGHSWPYSENWASRTGYGILYHIEGRMPKIKADSFVVIRQFHNYFATCSVLKFYYKK